MANELAGLFVPIGVAGAVIAVICAVIALVALARGSEGVVGGAIAAWIVGAMLSAAAGFAHNWIPALVAGAALVVALTAGGIVRAILVRRPVREPKPITEAVAATPTKPVTAEAPRQPAFEVPRAAFEAGASAAHS
ncbi:hypothetical protein OED01_15890 [Microbacterium sp. M28]|uniref:hypothetical protein n=1 Tax=Microbacterium sp. M28 TaxID=2962064 RepID=UPI0021F448CF|nr:hypothetical protein [Microbacterium sp. M28]UYO97059.1 hypothetical protein OED01_15890 [Microbacterium sp. M28]